MTALAQLQQDPYWVCYTPDKMPINPRNGNLAKADVPETWGTYEQAVAYQGRQHERIAGIGREMGEEESLVFIDLDHCRNPHTGAVTPLAARLLNSIHSYAEVSPSRCGIHIIAYGDIPGSLGADPDATDENRVEMYKERRYFTWTGEQVPGSQERVCVALLPVWALYCEIQRSRVKEYTLVPGRKASPLRPTSTTIEAYATTALERECERVATCHPGGRNRTLHSAALKLGQFCQFHLLDEQEVHQRLYLASLMCGLTYRESQKAIRAGMKIGMEKPPRTRKFEQLVAV